MSKRSVAPIIAAILLLLPVLYVATYLALVKPGPTGVFSVSLGVVTYASDPNSPFDAEPADNYRGGNTWAPRFYWPLEQIDRRLRPGEWDGSSLQLGTRSGVSQPGFNPAISDED
jgi:hypothetical protein